MSQGPFFIAARNFMLIALGIAFLAAGAGTGYYYGIHLPNIGEEREKNQRERMNLSQGKYKKCVSDANSSYAYIDLNKITNQDFIDIQKRADYKIKLCLDEFQAGV